jgi:periplasmic divalent cation tolerance protein
VRNSNPQHVASIVYLTYGSFNQARIIARTVVGEHLPVCGNIIVDMRSVYRWEGPVQEVEEALPILKARRACVGMPSARAKELQSLDVFCVVEIQLRSGNAYYFARITDETSVGGA